MERYFICLANSLKRGGRCIAGVEVTVDDGQWTVVRKIDGSPRWIRPIDRTTEFGEIMIDEARNIPLLSVVKLDDVVPIPQEAHQEDVHYSVMRVIGRVSASAAVLRQFVDESHPVIFYDTDRAIDIPTYQTADHSLMFVHADSADIVADVREDKTRYRMLLGYQGVTYDLSVTDPDYIEALNGGRSSLGTQADVYVTLSLGLVYEERHHKLVAAVIIPSYNDVAENIILSGVVETRELSVRTLTKAERKTIKRAFIVPTQHGLAVCFRRKGGGEDFLPLDDKSEGEAWDKVKSRRLMIVEHDDGMKKARILPSLRIGRTVCYFILWLVFVIMLIALSMTPFVRDVDGGHYYVILILLGIVFLIAVGSYIFQQGYFSSRSWLSRRLKWLTGNDHMPILKAGKKKDKEYYSEEQDSMVFSYWPSEKRFYITRTMYVNPLCYEKEYKARKSQIELRMEQMPIQFDWKVSDCDSILSFTVSLGLRKEDATKENVCCLRDVLKDLAKEDFDEHLFSKLMFDEDTVYLEFHHYNLIRMILVDVCGHIERYSPQGPSEEPSERMDELFWEIYEDNRLDRQQPVDLIDADEFECIWSHPQRQ